MSCSPSTAATEACGTPLADGTIPDDFDVPKQTIERQDRARTTLWNADNSNFEDLKASKSPC